MASSSKKGKRPIVEEETECFICFEPTDDYITCSCNAEVCIDCVERYLSISKDDKVIPKCPGCKKEYVYSMMKGFPAFTECVLLHLTTQLGEEARKHIEIESKIQQLVGERRQFVRETFPAAIYLTATIAMPDRLRKLRKNVKINVESKVRESSRKCMNMMCLGSLDENMECVLCGTKFCQRCERKLVPGHKCEESDIESLQMIKEMARCPKCKVPVFKAMGCNMMTCSNCGENFLYATSEKGGGGNHGANARIETRERVKMSDEFSPKLESMDSLDLMIEIESREPPRMLEAGVTSMLETYYQNDEHLTDAEMRSLARKYERLTKNRIERKRYFNMLAEIEDRFRNDSITAEYLEEVLSNI